MKNRLGIAFKQLSALQRRTVGRIFLSLMLMGAISMAAHLTFESGYRTRLMVFLFALLPALPMLAIIVFLGRYLAEESDEFIRMTVVRALLWGAAVTVAGDMMESALVALSAAFWGLDTGILTIMNFDLFFAASTVSLALQLRRNR